MESFVVNSFHSVEVFYLEFYGVAINFSKVLIDGVDSTLWSDTVNL